MNKIEKLMINERFWGSTIWNNPNFIIIRNTPQLHNFAKRIILKYNHQTKTTAS